eukprot:RCo054191
MTSKGLKLSFKPKQKKKAVECTFCHAKDHESGACPALSWCDRCGEKGHFPKSCPHHTESLEHMNARHRDEKKNWEVQLKRAERCDRTTRSWSRGASMCSSASDEPCPIAAIPRPFTAEEKARAEERRKWFAAKEEKKKRKEELRKQQEKPSSEPKAAEGPRAPTSSRPAPGHSHHSERHSREGPSGGSRHPESSSSGRHGKTVDDRHAPPPSTHKAPPEASTKTRKRSRSGSSSSSSSASSSSTSSSSSSSTGSTHPPRPSHKSHSAEKENG